MSKNCEPCLCGDPYCPRCFSQNVEENEEWASNYTVIKDCYFKTKPDEDQLLMSGLKIPSMKGGPYHFIGCDFHPRLYSLVGEYQKNGSVFENCMF